MAIQRWDVDADDDTIYKTVRPDGELVKFADHLAEMRCLTNENAALKAKVARLSAPVSDEEWVPAVTGLGTFRQSFNKIIAARAGGE